MRSHIQTGGSAARASVIFRRTEAAVRARAADLGLKFPTIRQLRTRATGTLPVAPGAGGSSQT